MTENEPSRPITDAQNIDPACRIPSTLGPALPANTCGLTPARELKQRGLQVVPHSGTPVFYPACIDERSERGEACQAIDTGVAIAFITTLAIFRQPVNSPIFHFLTNEPNNSLNLKDRRIRQRHFQPPKATTSTLKTEPNSPAAHPLQP